ncbi:MAG: hypothetical protein WC796_02485 [Candidatus Pacearchaeota archaeon]|jgi:hypothetical protein
MISERFVGNPAEVFRVIADGDPDGYCLAVDDPVAQAEVALNFSGSSLGPRQNVHSVAKPVSYDPDSR